MLTYKAGFFMYESVLWSRSVFGPAPAPGLKISAPVPGRNMGKKFITICNNKANFASFTFNV